MKLLHLKKIFIILVLILIAWPLFRFLYPALKTGGSANISASQDSTLNDKEESRADLEYDVNKLLRGDQIVLRGGIDKVFKLAEIREREGNDMGALLLYQRGVEVNATNIPYQMKLANLLANHARAADAEERARIVFELAEDEELIGKADDLLKSFGHPPKSAMLREQVDKNIEVILIPVGDISDRYLVSLQQLLEQRMGVSFPISPQRLDLEAPDRSYKEVFVQDYLRALKNQVGETKFSSWVIKLGFTPYALNSYDNAIKFLNTLFMQLGPDGQHEQRGFETQLQKAEKLKQYNTARLIPLLRAKFPSADNSRIKGYLAVMQEDMYEGESRFRFGAALPGYGVMSIKRFTSTFNNEDQNRPRLVDRALKQALSSATYILGIPRCTNPNCATAYPNSLPELDHKPDTLCSLCLERLAKYKEAEGK